MHDIALQIHSIMTPGSSGPDLLSELAGAKGEEAQQGAVGQEAQEWNQVKEHMSYSICSGQLVTTSVVYRTRTCMYMHAPQD